MPRLSPGYTRFLAETLSEKSVQEARKLGEEDKTIHWRNVTFAATGAARVTTQQLETLATALRQAAQAGGYPDNRDLAGQRRFDLVAAKVLADFTMVPAEAGRSDVWAFLTCVLVPDLVVWRFGETTGDGIVPPTKEARFLGGVRNTLSRLYWRGKLLIDAGHERPFRFIDAGAPEGLTEDNLVALIERPVLSAYPRLCVEIAGVFYDFKAMVQHLEDSPEQTLFREAMKRITRRAGFVCFSALTDEEQKALVYQAFRTTAQAMGADLRSGSGTRRHRLEAMLPGAIAEQVLKKVDEAQQTAEDARASLRAYMGWLEAQARKRTTVDTVAARAIADQLDSLLVETGNGSDEEAKDLSLGAAAYFLSGHDVVRWHESGGFEDDRLVLNVVCRVLERPDLAVSWEIGFPVGMDGRPLQLSEEVRGEIARISQSHGDLGTQELLEELRNYLALLRSIQSEQGEIDIAMAEALADGLAELLQYASRMPLKEHYRRTLNAAVIYFTDSDDVVADHQKGGLIDDVEVFNGVTRYLGRPDLVIEAAK